MASHHCNTCKHWKPPGNGGPKDLFFGFGTCQFPLSSENARFQQVALELTDGSGFWPNADVEARLRTKPFFGCFYHEEKE